MRKEYRVIYFEDTRYNNIERSIIVEGSYKDALAAIQDLKSSSFAANVSCYYPIASLYVSGKGNKARLNIGYPELRSRKFWN